MAVKKSDFRRLLRGMGIFLGEGGESRTGEEKTSGVGEKKGEKRYYSQLPIKRRTKVHVVRELRRR